MIGTALLLAVMGQAAAPVARATDETVVIGRRLRTWRGRVTPAGTALRCVTTNSTGDAEIDHIGCSAMVTCFTPMRPRMDAMGQRGRTAAERRAMRSAIEQELAPCLTQRGDQLVADLAERRAEARERSQNAGN